MVQPVQLFAPQPAYADPRAETYASILENMAATRPTQPSQSIGEAAIRGLNRGFEGFLTGRTASLQKQRQAEMADALANILSPPGEGGTVDPRNEQIAMLLESGAIKPDAFSDVVVRQLGYGEPPEPMIQQVYDESTGRNTNIISRDGGKSWQPLGGVETDTLSPEAENQKVRIAQAGAPSTTIDLGEGSFAKGLGTGLAEDFIERRGAAKDAVLSLQANAEARQLLDSGVITGFGADWKVSMGKALQQIGFNASDDALANTEAFVATRAQEVGRIIKLFGAGTGLSDADREFATKAAAGQITMNEESIRRILDINERASRNVLKGFNEEAGQIDPNLAPFPLTIDVPPMSETGGTATISSDEEYDALPSGTEFIGPDGVKRRKP